VEVGQEHGIDVLRRELAFAEPREHARPNIDEEARLALYAHEIARCGTSFAARATRAEYDEVKSWTDRCRAVRRRGG
jgi:hypothetical protein